ncbi:FtsX-like permease family protein [Flavobacterium salilacus subsp. salilacus]|uniref:cell division protein FtsX n=1 Tax=Flavobacterium TaxID=237 RepID=UPI0010757218|nr:MULTISPECIES: permease-like cell division protein FtsX [Flavobacterium]KAF2520119.1 FtsX-like permease family protein [Flavobacterium salilacus subsp. salilacus]MBE1613965.1 FtsX-like permease family protein [Flavobacterium sp. SaA2.13]NDI97925.1 FtsX-like permease family protein [Flavobacterium salilacus subsp. altitudinum]
MASSFEKFQKRRLISSYFSVVLSIFIVLTLLGALGLFVINTEKISSYVKENIPMTVFFKKEANDSIMQSFGEELKNAPYIKDYVYVSKEEAAQNNKDIMGDYENLLDSNPLLNSYDIHLKGGYVQTDSIKNIEVALRTNPMVADITYDLVLVEMANDNIKVITFWILVISGILAFIAMLLINSALRLSIYNHRFTIKTMQMVGATKSFIRRPFVWRGIKLGLIGSLLAIGVLMWLVYYVDAALPVLNIWEDWMPTAIVFGGVLAFGIIITAISTFFATQRFLNLRTDDLY